jgi:F-type H+-transporting ATPase subunit gamma
MPALIDLRRRIKSVQNTKQITQAMKSVASAKFRKAQKSVLEGRPYWHNFPVLTSKVAGWAQEQDHPLLQRREEKKVLGVVVSSDKGLCGAFNSNLLDEALTFFKNKSALSEVRMVLMGKKAVSFFERFSFVKERVYSDHTHLLSEEDIKELSQHVMRLFVLNRTDAVYIAYNEFKSILAPRVTIVQLLPIDLKLRAGETEGDTLHEEMNPDLEPKASLLLDAFLPLYVEKQIQHAFHESQAAEQAARMMAMDNATRSADDLIGDLTLVLNKIRQASITKELLEIMTAVEALGKR